MLTNSLTPNACSNKRYICVFTFLHCLGPRRLGTRCNLVENLKARPYVLWLKSNVFLIRSLSSVIVVVVALLSSAIRFIFDTGANYYYYAPTYSHSDLYTARPERYVFKTSNLVHIVISSYMFRNQNVFSLIFFTSFDISYIQNASSDCNTTDCDACGIHGIKNVTPTFYIYIFTRGITPRNFINKSCFASCTTYTE